MTLSRIRRAALPFLLLGLSPAVIGAQSIVPRLPAHQSPSVTTSGATSAPPASPAAGLSFCPDALFDQADATACIRASSTPVLGLLYPLGLDLNVDLLGNVGVRTLTPQLRLHVAGDLTVDGGVAFGNLSGLASGGMIFDFSHRLTDFSSSEYWNAKMSFVMIDPAIDLTGTDESFVHGSSEVAYVPNTNSRNIHYIEGSSHRAVTCGRCDVRSFRDVLEIAVRLVEAVSDEDVVVTVVVDVTDVSVERGL